VDPAAVPSHRGGQGGRHRGGMGPEDVVEGALLREGGAVLGVCHQSVVLRPPARALRRGGDVTESRNPGRGVEPTAAERLLVGQNG